MTYEICGRGFHYRLTQKKGDRKIIPENLRKTAKLIAENPNITIHAAAQHLNLSMTVT